MFRWFFPVRREVKRDVPIVPWRGGWGSWRNSLVSSACAAIASRLVGKSPTPTATIVFDPSDPTSPCEDRLLPAVVVYRPDEKVRGAVVISPTIAGDPFAGNVRSMVRACLSRGFLTAVHVRPGFREKLRTGRFNAVAMASVWGDRESLRGCVSALKRYTGPMPLAVLGMSAGAHETLSCEFEPEEAQAVVSISNAFSLRMGESLSNPVVCRMVSMQAGATSPTTALNQYRCSSVSRRNAYDLSCLAELATSRTPTLCLNALDDPIVPAACTYAGEAASRHNPMVRFKITDCGGHVGWPGLPWEERWHETEALSFICDALF